MTPQASVALITGASRGLGRALALAFAKKGFSIGLNYRANDVAAQTVAREIEKMGVKTLLLKADVSSSKEVNAMFYQLANDWGRLDVLVNNAGNVRNRTIVKMTDEEWRDVMAVNLDGPFYCTRAAIPFMRKQKEGCIINIASYIAARGARGAANYAAAKAGLINFTKTTAIEEGAHHIRANAVLPGFHVTDLNRDVWDKIEKDIRSQHLLPQMPDKNEMAEFVTQVAGLKTVSGQVFAFESRLL
ncbi:MAG: 3-oxoacyl-[acyl-carrier-protein] reductase FabG [Elusimicrobia bacterium]|nr:3-oxoacyl-[acyl-carrier-protein] reductase FabG [Elusimicrobiota bacterium]